jgi:putative ABC transport system permease protein
MISSFSSLPIRLLTRQRLRVVAPALGIMLGVAITIAALASGQMLIKQLNLSLTETLGRSDLIISSSELFSEATIKKSLSGLPIKYQANQLIFPTRIIYGNRSISSKAIALKTENASRLWMIKPVAGKFNLRKNNVVLSKPLATQLGITVGAKLQLLSGAGSFNKQVSGILNNVGLGNQNSVFLDLTTAQQEQEAPGKLNAVFIKFSSPGSLSKYRQILTKRLGASIKVDRIPATSEYAQNMMSAIKYILLAIGVISLILGMLLIYQSTSVSFVRRIYLLALLKANGASRRQITLIFLTESAIVGFLASVAGLFLGIGMTAGLLKLIHGLLGQSSVQKMSFSGWLVLLGIGLGIGSSLAATIIPVRKVSRLPVATGLRGLQTQEDARQTFLFSRLLHIASYPLKLLTPAAIVAERNIARHQRRFRLTVFSLIIGMALIVAVQMGTGAIRIVVVKYFNGFAKPAFVMRSQQMIGFGLNERIPINIANKLKQIKGVGSIGPLQISYTPYNGQNIGFSVESFRFIDTWICNEGNPNLAAKRFKSGGWITVTKSFSERNDIHVGDKVKLEKGGKNHTFKVAAVRLGIRNGVMLSWPDARKYYGINQADEIWIYPAAGTSLRQLEPRLRHFANQHGYSLLTSAEALAQINSMLSGFVALLLTLTAVISVITAIAIANMMLVTALERLRLIGLIRAQGMTRRQLARLLISESLLVGLTGLPLGLILGYLLGRLFVGYISSQMGITLASLVVVFPPMIYTAIVVLGILYITAVLPARGIARIPVAEALRYE